MTSLISIIIPTLNRADIIGNTLDSILNQSYQNWECIVVDDGSTDYTLELIEFYANLDKRIRYFNRPPSFKNGGNGSRNFGFTQSKGDYVNWFDSDDIMHPDFLKIKISSLLASDAICCISMFQLFKFSRGEMEILKTSNVLYNHLLHDLVGEVVAIPTSNPLWNKRKLQGVPLFDESLLQSQDLDFHSRVFSKNSRIEVVEKVLFFMRTNHNSITGDYYPNLSFYLDSYLSVRKKIISRSPEDLVLREMILKHAMGLFRYSLGLKNYPDCNKILSFIGNHLNNNSIIMRLSYWRVIFFFRLFRLFGKGETRFKRYLYLKL